jgi:hypothetical protein
MCPRLFLMMIAFLRTLTHLYTCVNAGLRNTQVLLLGPGFEMPLGALPLALKTLAIRSDAQFNHPLGQLPQNLNYLAMGIGFEQPLDELPRALTSLHLPAGYAHALHNLSEDTRITFTEKMSDDQGSDGGGFGDGD